MTRVSPPLDEVVASFTRLREWLDADGANWGQHEKDLSVVLEAFAAHRRAFTISTPREEEVERVAQALQDRAEELHGISLRASEWDTLARVAIAALATLTPREQRMEEALRHALTFIENRYSDLSPEKRATVSHIRSALSLQDKT